MTAPNAHSLIDAFTALPKLHRFGIPFLAAALVATLTLKAPADETNQPSTSNHDLITLTTAAALPPAFIASQSPAIALESSSGQLPSPMPSDNTSKHEKIKQIESLYATQQAHHITAIELETGDTLTSAFKKAGVSTNYMYHLLNGHKKAKSLSRIYPGHILQFELNDNGRLVELQHIESKLQKHVFTRKDDNYIYEHVERTPETRLVKAEGQILHSLYAAAKNADLEDRLTMSLASIFGWDIDFALDIRKDDRFSVVYEQKFLDGELLSTGDIVAAEFVNKGQIFQAVRYIDSQGNAEYYTPSGNTMRKAFLRTPIDFARISSHFNLRRKHPVLNKIRAHKGTDYAAPTGTPIKSAGDGKVIFAGVKGGYGNTLIIQHGQKYQTLYAHLKGFARKVRRGSFVKQGQIVGYVGSTGLATGPHLHYEFRVNGVALNPVTVKLPKAMPVAKSERKRFFADTKKLVAMLEGQPSATKIASKATDNQTTTSM